MTTSAPRASLTVREATRDDLGAVFRIERTSFPRPWPFEAFERFLGQSEFLVAEYVDPDGESTVGGYVVGDTMPNHGRPLGHVKDIAVRPDYRGRGVGSTLLGRVLGVMRGRGVARVKLEVREDNDDAISLYRRFGFTHHHTVPRYYENGDDAYVMVTELD